MRASFLLVLAGCTPVSGSQAVWGGYVFADPYVDDMLLSDGRIELLAPDGSCVVQDNSCVVAEESDTDGYYSLSVERGSDAVLRVSGPGVAPTVWRGSAPSADSAQWSFLYTRRIDFLDSVGASLGPAGPSTSLADTTSVWLWGAPLDPDAWAGAELTATDGDGTASPVIGLAVTNDGALSAAGTGPVDYFLAVDLIPGTVTFSVESSDGREASQSWPAQAGDLVSADFFALPSE